MPQNQQAFSWISGTDVYPCNNSMLAIHCGFNQIAHTTFRSVVNIAVIRIDCAGGMSSCDILRAAVWIPAVWQAPRPVDPDSSACFARLQPQHRSSSHRRRLLEDSCRLPLGLFHPQGRFWHITVQFPETPSETDRFYAVFRTRVLLNVG